MRRLGINGRLTAVVVCIWFITTGFFSYFTNLYWQLAIMGAFALLFVCSIVNLASATGRWRKDGLLVLTPLMACLLAFVLAPFIASAVRTSKFHRNNPVYERIVDGMRTGRIPLRSKPYFEESALEAGDAYMVLGRRSHGSLMVEFLTGAGFPVKHSGYLYVESPGLQLDPILDERWPRRRQIDAHWYRIAD